MGGMGYMGRMGGMGRMGEVAGQGGARWAMSPKPSHYFPVFPLERAL